MFKEKYLIFKEGEPASEYAPRRPDSRAALSEEAGKLAENLTKPTAEQILLNIFGTNFEEAQISLAANYLPLIQALSQDSQQLEYRGLKHNGKDFIVSWRKDGKDLDKTFSSYLPNMEPADFDELALLFSATDTDEDRAIERQVNEFCTKQIGSFLAKNGHDLPYKTFMVSYLVRVELIPILTAAYKHGTPYEFIPGEDGFTLKNQNKDFPEQQFYLSDYDENFNLKNPEVHNVSVQQGAPQRDENPDIVLPEAMREEDRQNTQNTMMNAFSVGGMPTQDNRSQEEYEGDTDYEELESYKQELFPNENEELENLKGEARNKDAFTDEDFQRVSRELAILSKNLAETNPELKELNEVFIKAAKHFSETGEEPAELEQEWKTLKNSLELKAKQNENHKLLAALDLMNDASSEYFDLFEED